MKRRRARRRQRARTRAAAGHDAGFERETQDDVIPDGDTPHTSVDDEAVIDSGAIEPDTAESPAGDAEVHDPPESVERTDEAGTPQPSDRSGPEEAESAASTGVHDGAESEGATDPPDPVEPAAGATSAQAPVNEHDTGSAEPQLEIEMAGSEPAPDSGDPAGSADELAALDDKPDYDGATVAPARDPSRHDRGAFRHVREPDRRASSASGFLGTGSTRPADPLAQARELEQAGQVDRAMNLYREILRTQPQNLEAHFALGSLHEKIGQHLQALEQFEMAKRADPENVDAAVRHAKAMAVLGRYDAAERELRRAVRLDPTRPEIFTSLGTIGVRRGLYAQAEQDLKRAIELDPESPAAHHYRGEALNQLGRVDEALGMLEQAARLDPGNPRTYYVMGIVLDKKQRPQEAGAMFRRSRELTPG